MAIKFIIIGGNVHELKEDILNMRKTLTIIEGQVPYTILISTKNKIEQNLQYEIEKTTSNVLLIIGDTLVRRVTSIIHNRIGTQDISSNLARLLSNLEEKLKLARAICKIRDQKLIIDMSGSCINALICLKENRYVIQQVAHSIAETHRIGSSPNDILNITPNSIWNYTFLKMEDVADAVDTIQTLTYTNISGNIKVEIVRLNDAYGRILCEDIHSKCDVPPYRTAVKHGYAVLASDGKGTRRVMKVQTTSSPFTLESGTCVWVKSGAPVPDGATAVVKVANTRIVRTESDSNDEIDEKEREIEVIIQPEEGENIRPNGCEIKSGTIILKRFKRIGIAEMGLLALCGYTRVAVTMHPSIGVLSIGNNLQEPGETLRPGHVYNSNKIALMAFLKENNLECAYFGITVYNRFAIIRSVRRALERVNILVTTGYANDKDLLKYILKRHFKATIYFGGVNVKPGKSTTFATCKINGKDKYILCLSGNPATVPIAAQLFVLPLLNIIRCNFSDSIQIPAYISSPHDLHWRPQYTWTTLKWKKSDIFANAIYPTHQNSSLLRHCYANALLQLDSNWSGDKIEGKFELTLYIGRK